MLLTYPGTEIFGLVVTFGYREHTNMDILTLNPVLILGLAIKSGDTVHCTWDILI